MYENNCILKAVEHVNTPLGSQCTIEVSRELASKMYNYRLLVSGFNPKNKRVRVTLYRVIATEDTDVCIYTDVTKDNHFFLDILWLWDWRPKPCNFMLIVHAGVG